MVTIIIMITIIFITTTINNVTITIILTEVYLCLFICVCVSVTGGVKVAMGTIHYTLWFNANKNFNPVLKKSERESGL